MKQTLWQSSQLLSTAVPSKYWEKTGCIEEGRVGKRILK